MTTLPAARALKRMEGLVADSPVLQEPLVRLDFKEFFSTRGVDYVGDEVRVAKNITWQGIAASLPSEVAQLDIREFCEGGVLDFCG